MRTLPDEIELRIRGVRTPIYCRPRTSDFAMLRQVLGKKEYDFASDAAPRVVIDAGANVGYASLFFANKYPQARVLAIEPDQGNCSMFRRNCSPYQSIQLVEGALWGSNSLVRILDDTVDKFAFQVTEDEQKEAPLIRAYALDSLSREYGLDDLDIVKMDIEGAECEVFTSPSREWLWKVGVLMVELHDRFRSGATTALRQFIEPRRHDVSRAGEYTIIKFHPQ
jgi:FkbM family methyltransferase